MIPEENTKQRDIERVVDDYNRRLSPFVSRHGTHIFRGGSMQSQGFQTGKRGWRITSDGDAEFEDGVFRGSFQLGGFQKTIDNTEDIQAAINLVVANGGGAVYLKPGTYTLTSDITLPSGVSLIGVDRDATIIDCNTSYSVTSKGTLVYDTGTVTIAPGDTTVVGGSTTFTSAMVGSYILLGSAGYFYWYEITGFTDTTHITIGTAYFGPDLSGAAYAIADIVVHTTLKQLTVTNASAEGIDIQYAIEIQLDDVVVYDCGTGVNMVDVVYPRLFLTSVENGINWDGYRVSGFKVDFCDFSNSTTGANVQLELSGDATFFDTVVNGSADSGIILTGCEGIAFLSVTVNSNTGHGFELVSGCNGNQFTDSSFSGNGTDGLSMAGTCDNNIIVACSIEGNGAYGIDIEAATCDNNIIGLNYLATNTSGQVNDAGTTTKIRSNIGVADN